MDGWGVNDDKVYVYRKMIHSIFSLCELKCRFWLVVSFFIISDTRNSKTSGTKTRKAVKGDR